MRWLKWVVIASLFWGGWNWYSHRPVPRLTPGATVAQEPRQTSISAPTLLVGKYQITPLARFDIEALVLGREDYSHDKEAELSPLDLALGWGPMSDPSVLSQLEISQGARFYHWHYNGQPPIPVEQIIRSSANMHLIPANAVVASTLKRVHQGQIVSFSGYLVRAEDPVAHWSWTSSLTREDTGAGACELVWVEDAHIAP